MSSAPAAPTPESVRNRVRPKWSRAAQCAFLGLVGLLASAMAALPNPHCLYGPVSDAEKTNVAYPTPAGRLTPVRGVLSKSNGDEETLP